MNRKGLGYVLGFAGMMCFIGLTSCAHDQQLTSITVQPATENFGASDIPVNLDAGLNVQLRALGSYIHPPVTKDITGQVTWTSNTPDMVTVSSTGLATATGLACGSTLISATVTTNKVLKSIFDRGDRNRFHDRKCHLLQRKRRRSGANLTVTFAAAAPGTMTSTPSGLGCASTCSSSFPSGTAVTLTATPNGSTFGGWSGCDSVAGQACTVNLTSDRTVAVTFN
jgi:hypothetical protein